MMEAFETPVFLTHSSGHRFPVYRWGSGPKVLLFAHGWSGRFSQFVSLFQYLEQSNLLQEYTVLGYNAVGHYGAEGTQCAMPIVADCIDLVAKKYGPIDLVIAHSLGSNACMYAQQKLGTPIAKQVLIAPPGSITAMVELFCGSIGFNRRVFHRIIENLNREFTPEFDENSCPALALTNALPTLVFHDTDDRDTPIALGREVGQRMAHGRYIETQGLGHRRILRDAQVHSEIAAFMKE